MNWWPVGVIDREAMRRMSIAMQQQYERELFREFAFADFERQYAKQRANKRRRDRRR